MQKEKRNLAVLKTATKTKEKVSQMEESDGCRWNLFQAFFPRSSFENKQFKTHMRRIQSPTNWLNSNVKSFQLRLCRHRFVSPSSDRCNWRICLLQLSKNKFVNTRKILSLTSLWNENLFSNPLLMCRLAAPYKMYHHQLTYVRRMSLIVPSLSKQTETKGILE